MYTIFRSIKKENLVAQIIYISIKFLEDDI